MAKQKEAWDKLSMLDKTLLIKLSVDNGVSSLKLIRDTYNLYANGGNLAHKFDGELVGLSLELNTKTYKEKKESSAYPMYYNVLSLSLGDTDLPGSILRALVYGNSKDPSIYTGSYYFGDRWGYGPSKELPQNRNLISLYLDGNTTGFEQFNGKPIVLDGDTLTQTLYKGSLLPQDTIYLRPESKATIARMAKDKDLLKINNSFPGWMSYSSKYNFLDSPYFLDKYEGKAMDDANNLNISFKQNSDGSYYADVFDLWDLTGTGGYKAGARLEKKLAEDSIENNGPFILRLHIPIVFNKDSVSDGRFLNAISVGLWQKEIDDTNKKSTGGPLYPFSFEKNPFLKTPVVRYDDGGFFARLFGKKDTIPTPEEIKADRVERFINDTWETEYSVPRGYDPTTGLFYPYKSPEGGTKTIGPGFKLRADGSGDATMFSAKEAAKGVTREQINEKLRAQGELQYDKVLEFLNQKGNRLPVDTINPNIMNGLMDLRFLIGALGGWDNLREAVLNGDLESIKKESLVTFKDGDTGKIKPDVRRNELRAKKFWHYD